MSSIRGASFEDSRFGNVVLGGLIIADADSTACFMHATRGRNKRTEAR
jgi:hypothetical protein